MKSGTLQYRVQPGGKVSGAIQVPGDKSISHRAIMLGAIAEGSTRISGFLEGEDALATIQAYRDMGVAIEGPNNGNVIVHGVGMHGLKTPMRAIDLGNSGTAMRLMAGILSAQSFDSTLIGDESLTARPMKRVTDPLAQMGAVIKTADGGRPPLNITGGQPLQGMAYTMPMASAQVKSCLLLAGLYAEGTTSITEPGVTRDHTERMLRGFGYSVEKDDATVSVQGGGMLKATDVAVPGDISSAAFFMVAAAIAPGSDITLTKVGVNPTRIGILSLLRLMGADIGFANKHCSGGEDIADIRVRHCALNGIEIPRQQVPLAIDEFPVLFIAAAVAEGRTILTGAEELRVKETDRIQVMADNLQALGVKAQATPDGMIIDGGEIQGGTVDSCGDHRIAMAFAVAGLIAKGPITILNCNNVATSFPGFPAIASRAGISLEEKTS